jgi:predicted nucleic acid-binding Zn ribbon protein
MPIREYKCDNAECENSNGFEKFHLKVGEQPLTTCPLCGSSIVLQMSAFSPHFKGPGFYATDYKDTEKKKKEPKPIEVGGKTVNVGPKEKASKT